MSSVIDSHPSISVREVGLQRGSLRLSRQATAPAQLIARRTCCQHVLSSLSYATTSHYVNAQLRPSDRVLAPHRSPGTADSGRAKTANCKLILYPTVRRSGCSVQGQEVV